MHRFHYRIAAEHAPHGHGIDGSTKAASDGDLRLVLASLYGHEAARAAEVWEAVSDIATITEGRRG